MATLGNDRTRTRRLGQGSLAALAAIATIAVSGCTATITTSDTISDRWVLQLANTADGDITDGSMEDLISTIRAGCQVRIAWGARRAADPSRTIEHSAEPLWISIRSGETVTAQIGGFSANLSVLGEDPAEHPRYERFGGTEQLTEWRADIGTDGSFNAVWFRAGTGEFIERIPQRHPMRWYADCDVTDAPPLYPSDSATRVP
ncbi:MAG: hypothetical protein AAGC71_11245 [Pseudomonadota bacterium]